VGVLEKEKNDKPNIHDKNWNYFYKNRNLYFQNIDPEYVDPKLKDFSHEKNSWMPITKYSYYF
jgi:hypothetical protein